MTTNVLTIAADRPVAEALHVYQTQRGRAGLRVLLLRARPAGRPRSGVLSMRQVLIAAPGARVREVMTREPVTVGAGR